MVSGEQSSLGRRLKSLLELFALRRPLGKGLLLRVDRPGGLDVAMEETARVNG